MNHPFIPDHFTHHIKRIEVEITSKCNLRCKCCPLTYEKEYRNQHLSLIDFFKMMDHIQPFLKKGTYLSLNGFGEFFQYPHYRELSQYLIEERIPFTFCTNGLDMDVNYFSEFDCRAPIDDPITLTVKLGKCYHDHRSIRDCKDLILSSPQNAIAFQTLYGENSELNEFCIQHGYSCQPIVLDNWAGYFEFKPVNAPNWGCERFFPNREINISVDGGVSVCCKDFGARKGRVGNILQESLLSILNNKPYQDWLQVASEHRLAERELCKNCFRSRYTEGA